MKSNKQSAGIYRLPKTIFLHFDTKIDENENLTAKNNLYRICRVDTYWAIVFVSKG